MTGKLIQISKTYHERVVMSGMVGDKQACEICYKGTWSTYSIEHDSQDHSKDMNICIDCYDALLALWRECYPGKICPV